MQNPTRRPRVLVVDDNPSIHAAQNLEGPEWDEGFCKIVASRLDNSRLDEAARGFFDEQPLDTPDTESPFFTTKRVAAGIGHGLAIAREQESANPASHVKTRGEVLV
jgi:hypothetical protein